MFHRRLSKSLLAQNWSAFAIEFVLLILGVFLGIQVANWNQERLSNELGKEFTQRLREDLQMEAWNRAVMTGYQENVLANAKTTLAALEGKQQLTNEALLIAAYRATQYGDAVRHRGTYDELTSTGNLGLIKDRLLRQIATEIYQGSALETLKEEGTKSRYRVAFRMHIAIEVQEAVAIACGDRSLTIGDYAGIATLLNCPCKTSLPANQIDLAAATLRNDSSLIPLLRLRIADIKSQLAMLALMLSPPVAKALEQFKIPAPVRN